MLIQVRTDNHIPNRESFGERVRADVEAALSRRFAERLRRVEVYVQDTNAQKGGVDKRCSIEAHLAGHQPLAVHEYAADVDDAVHAALEKLVAALDHTLGRLQHHKGHTPASGEPLY